MLYRLSWMPGGTGCLDSSKSFHWPVPYNSHHIKNGRCYYSTEIRLYAIAQLKLDASD